MLMSTVKIRKMSRVYVLCLVCELLFVTVLPQSSCRFGRKCNDVKNRTSNDHFLAEGHGKICGGLKFIRGQLLANSEIYICKCPMVFFLFHLLKSTFCTTFLLPLLKLILFSASAFFLKMYRTKCR